MFDFAIYLLFFSKRVSDSELPALDMFVTTADPVLEPPIITVNTVLSLLALDYPANKLACYVSDDGCSPLTFYALVEATKFAEIWVPFCKKYNVQCRAPFRYFCDEAMANNNDLPQFKHDWLKMKVNFLLFSCISINKKIIFIYLRKWRQNLLLSLRNYILTTILGQINGQLYI